MNCPVDNSELRITDRQGIEIDYCPKCRGVWLDRGELDKMIERAGAVPARDDRYDDYDRRRADDRDHDHRSSDYDRGHPRKSKRRSMLDELFDFD